VGREEATHWVDGHHRADSALGWAAETKRESEAANFERMSCHGERGRDRKIQRQVREEKCRGRCGSEQHIDDVVVEARAVSQ
jgi:hypothetical protein